MLMLMHNTANMFNLKKQSILHSSSVLQVVIPPQSLVQVYHAERIGLVADLDNVIL